MEKIRINRVLIDKITYKIRDFTDASTLRIYTDKKTGSFFLLSNMREVDISAIKIVLHNEASVSSWCEVLGCNESELLNAIDAVGNFARDVDEYLEKNKGSSDLE